MKPIGLYIHVPFCCKKCPYCDFYSLNNDEDMMDKYTESICEDATFWSNKLRRKADTLYFGGGTPNLLGSKRLYKIISVLKEKFCVDDNSEITIEVNPESYNSFKIENLIDIGVNRLSIGMQSINNLELDKLGRRHRAEDVIKVINSARNSGINNISLDIMLGISGQNKNSLKETINFCISNEVEHISAYILKIEKGTLYYKNKKELTLPNDDEVSSLYLYTCNELRSHGFIQYEISNFACQGKESKHNLKYWKCEEYLGLGPSAHSFINGKRFYYSSDLTEYIDSKKVLYDGEGGSEEEYIMLNLRLSHGINYVEFKNRFGYELPSKYYDKAKKYQKYNMVNITEDSIFLTCKGFLLSNRLISDIIY